VFEFEGMTLPPELLAPARLWSRADFPVKAKTLDAFDLLVVVFLNIGWFYAKKPVVDGYRESEFYTLPVDFICEHLRIAESGWEKVMTKGLDLDEYRDWRGFDRIAEALKIEYPSRGEVI
jgi:hypothetical protein